VQECINKGDPLAGDRFLATDFVDHTPGPAETPTRDGFKKEFASFLHSFPDLHTNIEDMVAEGDKVAMRISATATHKGEFLGLPQTGKRIIIQGIFIYAVRNGQIFGQWEMLDSLGLMQQLGIV
jgi:steroid delta-isomerase-like uncharacterized protein